MKNNKFIIFFVVFSVFFFIANIALAHEQGEKGDTGLTGMNGLPGKAGANGLIGKTGLTGKVGLTGKSGVNGVNATSYGVASAIAASQNSFDYSTFDWQGSFAIGAFNSNTAFSFGLAKRYKKVLINTSITQEEGKLGGGMGLNWHF